MRKVNMKRRGRSLKADDAKEDAEEVSNGDVADKSDNKKRKSRSKNADENGENVSDTEATDVETDTEVKKKKGKGKAEEAGEEPPEAKKKKKGKKAEKSDSESDEEPDAAKKKKPAKKADDGKSDDEQDGKKKKTAKKGEGKKGDDDEEPDEEYEVEAIIDDKKVRKTRHYLIRWKGFSSEEDTWEPEHTLNCTDLLKKYKEAKAKKEKESKNDDDEEVDDKKEYEVERIVEVHFKRDGKREFLVNWKGYSTNDSTWEPEEHLNCADLISKFMSKVEDAKKIDQRALRTYRPPTERFTLMTNDSGRRVSRRNTNKQRIRYVDCE